MIIVNDNKQIEIVDNKLLNSVSGGGGGSSFLDDANLMSYWRFEDNGNDSKGTNNFTGTVQYTAGKYGKCGYWSVGDEVLSSTFTWIPTDFTISFWLNPTRTDDYACQIHSNKGWGAWYFHSDAIQTIYCGTLQSERFIISNGITLNEWHQYVFTYVNSTGIANIYKDGDLLDSKSMTAPVDFEGFSFGTNAARYGLDGYVDDALIFTRALSATEVGELYIEAHT